MPRQTKDLFDESTMTFGEHLEVLRVHLWKAIIGLAVAVVITLIYGQKIVGVVRRPIDQALIQEELPSPGKVLPSKWIF